MEPEGVPIPSIATFPPLISNDHPGFPPLGSPDLSKHHHLSSTSSSDHPPATLMDELRDKIIKQVEYYFSDENLRTDNHLMKYVIKNKGGYVPIGVITFFRKMKKLTRDISLIATTLRESSVLVVSANRNKVKQLPPVEVKDPTLCTIVVENLPDDHSVKNLQRIFGEAGIIQQIVICDPHAARDSRKLTTTEKLLSAKLHALVEYKTMEAVEKAMCNLTTIL